MPMTSEAAVHGVGRHQTPVKGGDQPFDSVQHTAVKLLLGVFHEMLAM